MDREANSIGHLDLLRIDAVRAGEGTPEEAAHIDRCAACRESLEAVRRTAEVLKGLERSVPEVPAEIDEAILREFQRAVRTGPKVIAFPLWRRWVAPVAALAAAAIVALVVLPPLTRERLPEVGQQVAEEAKRAVVLRGMAGARGDVNGDGRIDILDAYRLAVTLERGGDLLTAWDADGDGMVDPRDVDALARMAVSVL